MQKRKLGNSGLEVSPLCFGGNVFGWTLDEAASFKLLDAYVAAGFNFIDTADVYSKWAPGNRGGESEVVIGNPFDQMTFSRDIAPADTFLQLVGVPHPQRGVLATGDDALTMGAEGHAGHPPGVTTAKRSVSRPAVP